MASSSDYTIYLTDRVNKDPFIIKAYSANGPINPTSTTPYPSAVSANTSLVLLGKGMFDYGEPIQTNLVHILENFANPTPPTYPIQGQLWYHSGTSELSVYTGTHWKNIITNSSFATSLDLNNEKIINLANPTNPQDAVNLQYLSSHYLSLIGGTLTGDLVMNTSNIIIPTAPTLSHHAVNKLYVDTELLNLVGSSGTGYNFIRMNGSSGISGTFQWNSGSITLNTTSLDINNSTLTLTNSNLNVHGQSTFYNTVNINSDIFLTTSTIHGQVSISGDFNITGPTSLGYISVGTNRIIDVVDPLHAQDVVTKHYLDIRLANLMPPDGTIVSGSYDKNTGILSISSSVGPVVHIPNFYTTADDIDVYQIRQTTNNNSWVAQQSLGKTNYPNISIQDAFNIVDTGLSTILNPRKRYINTITVPNQLTITLPFYYVVEQHTLFVSINGVKYYNSVRGYSTITLPNGSKNTDILSLTANTSYSFSVVIDGGTSQTITITTPVSSPYTYIELIHDINLALTNAVCVYNNISELLFFSNISGVNSSVQITDISLFAALTSTITNGPSGVDFSYVENGPAYSLSNTITFLTDPGIGKTIEIIDLK